MVFFVKRLVNIAAQIESPEKGFIKPPPRVSVMHRAAQQISLEHFGCGTGLGGWCLGGGGAVSATVSV